MGDSLADDVMPSRCHDAHHSAVNYMFVLEITEVQASLFGRSRRTYLDDFVQRIRSIAPGVRGSESTG